MKLIATEDSSVLHSGSVFGGTVSGTFVPDASESWITIEGNKIGSSLSILDIPSHFFTPLLTHSHQFNPDTFTHDFVTIEGNLIVTQDSQYAGDITVITDAGSNIFVTIS